MLGAAGVGGDEGQVDFRLHRAGKFFLGAFRRFLQALEGHAVLGQVDAALGLEFLDQVLDNALVEVLAAQESVAVGGAHFHHIVTHFEDGNIKGAAAQVEHRDFFVGLFIETVGQRGRR